MRLHDAFLHRRHLCLAFERLGLNLFELLKRNGFRGLSVGLLRLFLTREFRLRATQQTSPEFLAAAAKSPRFSEADKALLAGFLEKTDLIKFARVQATTQDSEQLLEQARQFVKGGVPA